MYYAYVLLSLRDQKFYIGFTGDLKRKLAEHRAGKNKNTKGRLPLKLLYYEAHLSKTDAQRRERYFKTAKGKSTLRQMLRDSLDLFSAPYLKKQFLLSIKLIKIAPQRAK